MDRDAEAELGTVAVRCRYHKAWITALARPLAALNVRLVTANNP